MRKINLRRKTTSDDDIDELETITTTIEQIDE